MSVQEHKVQGTTQEMSRDTDDRVMIGNEGTLALCVPQDRKQIMED